MCRTWSSSQMAHFCTSSCYHMQWCSADVSTDLKWGCHCETSISWNAHWPLLIVVGRSSVSTIDTEYYWYLLFCSYRYTSLTLPILETAALGCSWQQSKFGCVEICGHFPVKPFVKLLEHSGASIEPCSTYYCRLSRGIYSAYKPWHWTYRTGHKS